MKLTIDPFDTKSVSEAIAKLERYKREFADKEREFLRRLALVGFRVADAGFDNAQYDSTNKDVVVQWESHGDRAVVIATGKTVGFIEFGTGVRNREWDGFGVDYVPPKHGTYGKGKGANPKGWYFTDSRGPSQHTYGNPPAEAMIGARDEMVAQVAQIAREVWNDRRE